MTLNSIPLDKGERYEIIGWVTTHIYSSFRSNSRSIFTSKQTYNYIQRVQTPERELEFLMFYFLFNSLQGGFDLIKPDSIRYLGTSDCQPHHRAVELKLGTSDGEVRMRGVARGSPADEGIKEEIKMNMLGYSWERKDGRTLSVVVDLSEFGQTD